MVDTPKFNFNNSSIKSDEELKAKLDADGGGFDKFFKPGKHEVRITKIEYQSLADDPNWGKYLIHVEGTGQKTTRGQLFVPIKDTLYRTKAGKETTVFFKRFQDFMSAVGVTVTIKDLTQTLNTIFGNVDKSPLLGTNVALEMGYDGNYVKYDGKDDIGNKRYLIEMADGSLIVDTATGKAAIFSGFDAAMAHAEQNQIKVQKYPQILKWVTSTTPTSKAAANW